LKSRILDGKTKLDDYPRLPQAKRESFYTKEFPIKERKESPDAHFSENTHKLLTIPHTSLNKRHNALAYHRVRGAIASDVI
jgi:hypothetical protein